ncbi:T-complex 1 subunit gamma [Gossypium australe]|uniref:T-complex 1 subunit gamma n=1 Tax=Gossypium australe TaxID=47621 RepID=A0A5B6W6K6_9ROSI|nr:T-complex 1 subunit gamma [Gossypium australe]
MTAFDAKISPFSFRTSRPVADLSKTLLKNVIAIFLFLATSRALDFCDDTLDSEIYQRWDEIPRYSPCCDLNFFRMLSCHNFL